MGRPRLSDEDREQRRLERNRKARERRAEIRREKDAAKAKLARSGVEKSGSPTDEFEPTAEDRLRVESLAGLGMRHDEIALMVVNPSTAAPINEKTLRLRFERELAIGPVKANSKVGESLYQQATGTGGVPRSTAAGIFWAKTRMGWRETTHVEMEVKSGVLVARAGTTREAWVAAAHAENESKTDPKERRENE